MTQREVFFLVPALVLAASEVALACPICFRVEESPTTDGIQAAVLVLFGVTTVVLGGFARFAVGFVRHERRQSAGRKVDPAGNPEVQE
jgi:hypothetical protein